MSIKYEERKKQILEAASNCFSNKGFHKTSMQDICNEVNMSPGSLYRYFKSKEDIIETMAQQESAQCLELLETLKATDDIIGSLIDNANCVLSRMLERRVAAIFVEITSEANRNPRIHDMLAKIDAKVIALYKDVIETEQQQGKIKSSIDALSAAQLIIAIINGLTYRSIVTDEYNVDMIKKELGNLFSSWLDPQ